MYSNYCCGCGLCESLNKCKLCKDKKGFLKPDKETSELKSFCENVCPASGVQCNSLDSKQLWGRNIQAYKAYSSDDNIRFMASSGGVLTSLCCYLLDYKLVDGIVHMKEDKNDPISTITVCSTTSSEVIEASGSRYSSSSPLRNIKQYLDDGKKYAFVGKPCDVTGLRNYSKLDSRVNESFPYMLSFFCAGAPSELANRRLLEKMNCDYESLKSLKYRGNGWPGYATSIDKNGKHQLLYREAWRDTLGRDIRLMCRFCLDGIGELADISCCDAWKIGSDKKPLFEECDGENAVFCRTSLGYKLFNDACEAGYIVSSSYPSYKKELKYYQRYQYDRRVTMLGSIIAMKLLKKGVPNYDFKVLNRYAKKYRVRTQIKRFIGTYKRAKNGKMDI